MKQLITICVILGIASALYAQLPRDTIFYDKNSNYIVYDSTQYKLVKARNGTHFFKGDSLLAKTKLFSLIKSMYYDEYKNQLYAFSYLQDYLICNLETGAITVDNLLLGQNIRCHKISGTNIYCINAETSELLIVDIITKKIISSTKIPTNYYCYGLVKMKENHNCLVITTDMDGGEPVDIDYYFLDEHTEKINIFKNNKYLKNNIDFYRTVVEYYDITDKYLFMTENILDSSYKLFSNRLLMAIEYFDGIVIHNNKTVQYLCSTYITDEKGNKDIHVLIPFIPDPFKEKAMYEIYENIELKAQDLQRFDTFDLRLLRNMVFAKHNYAFKDKFLQAYFNLYSFYGYKKERLTDVNHLLTVADKKNLELIQQASKNKN